MRRFQAWRAAVPLAVLLIMIARSVVLGPQQPLHEGAPQRRRSLLWSTEDVSPGIGGAGVANQRRLAASLESLRLRDSNTTTSPGTTSAPANKTQECTGFKNMTNPCYYVTHADECAPDGGFLNYLGLTYCTFGGIPGGISFMIAWIFVLFIALGNTAEDFFCPALSVISDSLHLSHNVAGVTFLALGNGAPDIFSVYSAVVNTQDGIKLALGELFGAGVFVTTVVVGTVSILVPFKLTRRPFVRDVVVYLVAATWTMVVLQDGKIHLWESIGYIVVYVLYVVVVIVGRKIYQGRKKKTTADPLAEKMKAAKKEEMKPVHPHIAHSLREGLDLSESMGIAALMPTLQRADDHTEIIEHATAQEQPTDTDPLLPSRRSVVTVNPWADFFASLRPFEMEDFREASVFNKFLLIASAPVNLLLTISIPVVDMDEEDQNWKQYLTMLQMIIAPSTIIFGADLAFTKIGGVFPLWLLGLLIGITLALFVWAFTRASVPPKYHFLLAYMGFAVSVIWIYVVANEIVNVLQAIGALFGISQAVLGLTVLAWGNSIGDFVSNMTVAKQGFPQMAAGACFGGPALNMLLGIGISTAVASISRGGSYLVHDQSNHQLTVSCGFLLLSLLSSLIIIPARGFHAGKPYGIYLIVVYVAYLASSLAIEFSKK